MTRIERDLLGSMELPDDVLWGIHTARARANFPSSGRHQPPALIRAFALVKKAAALTNRELGTLDETVTKALVAACDEMVDGTLDNQIRVEPMAGGAGTSLNMNVNEVLANRANQLLGQPPGSCHPVHPLDSVNLHQSTNDVFATAVRVAAIGEFQRLETAIVALQTALQERERLVADIVLVGRTQLQDAVPFTAGQMFGTWAEALARDRWRVFKCIERLKVVNLGGTAIGTGVGAPRQYIFKVIDHLRTLSGLPLSRAENPVEATANQDTLAEADGILSALAVNIQKMSGDLRLLSMGAVGEFRLPAVQAGSSIMPGKINPVIAEYATQCAMEVMAGHMVLTTALAQGNLQLSQFLPLAAWHLLDHLRLLAGAVNAMAERCIPGIEVDAQRCGHHLEHSLSVAAALVPVLGYERVQEAVRRSRSGETSLRQALLDAGAEASRIEEALSPARLRRLGD